MGHGAKMLQMHQQSTSRSSQRPVNQPNSLSSPASKVPSSPINGLIERTQEVSNEEDLSEEQHHELSSDEDSLHNMDMNDPVRYQETKEIYTGTTEKGLTLLGHPKSTIEHFSRALTFIQKKDLQRLYIPYLKEQFFLNRTPARKVIIESPCGILKPLNNCKGTICMTNYELIFFYDIDI